MSWDKGHIEIQEFIAKGPKSLQDKVNATLGQHDALISVSFVSELDEDEGCIYLVAIRRNVSNAKITKTETVKT